MSFAPLFARLAQSKFRSRFRLEPKERAYLTEKTLPVVLEHGRRFVVERLAPAEPRNDGRQTPMRGHPVFVAQHATATCCRGCLQKWHQIPAGRPLEEAEIDYVLRVIEAWLVGCGADVSPAQAAETAAPQDAREPPTSPARTR
jgi:hypothetical protein